MQSKIGAYFKRCSSQQSKSAVHSPSSRNSCDGEAEKRKEESEVVVTCRPSNYNRDDEIERGLKQQESHESDSLSRPDGLKSIKVLSKKRNFAQLHLEVGQSNFMLHACPVCEFMYTPGEDGDEKVHKTFHKNYIHGIPFKGWRNERVISVCEIGRIILVKDDDPHVQQKKVQDVVHMMEIELGEGWILTRNCKVYLFISSHRVSGCLVAEPIEKGYRIISSSKDETSHVMKQKEISESTIPLQFGGFNFQREIMRRNPRKERRQDGGAVLCDNESVACVCGVRAIWVSRSNRRKCIASYLLDAVRKSFCRELILGRSELAFSEPTSDGMNLICSYGGSSFLVYKTGCSALAPT